MTPERDYELKLDYLTKQYDRLWDRFHYFLTVQLALFGYAGYLVFEVKSVRACIIPILLGILVSFLWFVVGAQDRALVKVYRDNATKSAELVSPGYGAEHAGAEVGRRFFDRRSWYVPGISITRLPATMAILVMALWILIWLLLVCRNWTVPQSWRPPDPSSKAYQLHQ